MPDEKEITRCFIFYNDLIAGGKSYDEIIRPVTNRLNKILDIEKGEYIEEPDLYSISMRKEITLFHKIMNYIETGKSYQEVFFMQTYSQLKDISSRFRIEKFKKLCEKYPYIVYGRDGLFVCADTKNNYGKELSDLVKSEIKKLKTKFVEKFVNGIYIFLPKEYIVQTKK